MVGKFRFDMMSPRIDDTLSDRNSSSLKNRILRFWSEQNAKNIRTVVKETISVAYLFWLKNPSGY